MAKEDLDYQTNEHLNDQIFICMDAEINMLTVLKYTYESVLERMD